MERQSLKLPAWMRMSTAFVGAGLCLSQVSTGGTIDRPHFNVDGIAIVWAAESGGTAPIVSDFIVDSGGADTDLIHVVDAGDESAMADGMAVAARWREETEGLITDIEAFVPMGGAT